jgi:predicted Zn-dependent peptidase
MKFMKKKLKNGMTVIMEARELPLVSVSITNRFGGGYEDSKIKGIAHFIEHLVFTGTETRSHEDISREIEKKGGVLNAFTWHEVTSFWFKMPSEHLFAGFDILVDILKNPKFDSEKFEKERKVILEEIKVYHDNPRSAVSDQIDKNMFENPFGELVIGSKESVSSLERDFVFDYFKNAYSPENYIVTVVGKGDFEEICAYLESNFQAGGGSEKMKEIKKKRGDSVEERDGIDQAHFILAMHAPLPSSEDFKTLEVLDAYLASGMSSRLFLEIREKRGLAYTVSSSISGEKNWAMYSIYVGTTKEKVEEVKKIILEEFNKVGEMSEKDLLEAKERIIGLRRVLSEESTNVMNELMFAELAGDAKEYYNHEEMIGKVSLEEVKALARELIKEYSTAAIIPK